MINHVGASSRDTLQRHTGVRGGVADVSDGGHPLRADRNHHIVGGFHRELAMSAHAYRISYDSAYYYASA